MSRYEILNERKRAREALEALYAFNLARRRNVDTGCTPALTDDERTALVEVEDILKGAVVACGTLLDTLPLT